LRSSVDGLALSSLRHLEASIDGLEHYLHLNLSRLVGVLMFFCVEEHFDILLKHWLVQQLFACGPLFGIDL
jgi:hypothetical protein